METTSPDENITTRTRIMAFQMYMQEQEAKRAQLAEEDRKRYDALVAQVQRVADAIDEQNGRNRTVLAAAKRAVLQFLNLIGWLK